VGGVFEKFWVMIHYSEIIGFVWRKGDCLPMFTFGSFLFSGRLILYNRAVVAAHALLDEGREAVADDDATAAGAPRHRYPAAEVRGGAVRTPVKNS
jgi:hypothetical protein